MPAAQPFPEMEACSKLKECAAQVQNAISGNMNPRAIKEKLVVSYSSSSS
jgi:hypothetical protein